MELWIGQTISRRLNTMKFSFIRFFREELAWLAAHDRPYYDLLLSYLRSGHIPVDALKGDRLDTYVCEYRTIEHKPCCAELLLSVMSKRSGGFVEFTFVPDEDESYVVLSLDARQLLPKYIPELTK
jgi:hypothetical protein